MDLAQADKLSGEIVAALAPHCAQIAVAGSIRRRKRFPNDIDIVLIPGNQGALAVAMQSLGKITSGAGKLNRLTYRGVAVDLYIATPQTWATLLLIRTGSKEHNQKLCMLAKSKGWTLHADGRGILDGVGNRLAGDSEESFFTALGLAYVEPERRA